MFFCCFQVKELARELHTQHFSSINPDGCLVTTELGRVVQDMVTACQGHNQDTVSDCKLFHNIVSRTYMLFEVEAHTVCGFE